MSTRTLTNRTRPKPCLLCYREYFDNSIGLKHESNQSRLSTESTSSDNHQVFTLFCKILEMDETIYSNAWDFETETLPFCASCASLAIRVSRLYDEMAVIQQEIMLSTDIIKGTLEKSQDCLTRERLGQNDQRIDAFRNHVFQEITKTLSPNILKRSMFKRSPDYETNGSQTTPGESPRNSGNNGNTLVFHRQSVDDEERDHDHEDSQMEVNLSTNNGSNGQRDSGYSLGFYTEREYNNNNNNQSYRNNNKGNGWDKNKRAVFVHDDIEVYEVQGERNEGYGMLSRLSKTSTSPEPNQTNILESQLRIQRSYNNHFNNISEPEPNSVHFMTPEISSVVPSIRQRQFLPNKASNQQIRIRDGNHHAIMKPQHGVNVNGNGNSSRTHTNGSATSHPPSFKRSPSATSPQFKMQQQLEPTEGIHACQLCSKTYTKPYQLKAHLRLHTGEKPYRCSICFKTFRLAGNLRVHVRIHTGETPYECNYCGKRCTQKSQLNTHVLIHHDANGKRKK